MIRYKDTILENYSIDPVTAIITNSKGEVQKTYILNGRPYFKGHKVYEWQLHTYLGYKKGFDIHHIDENIMNNSLENLVYLTKSEHSKLHNKGENHPMYGKHISEETKKKLSESQKGKASSNKDRIWVNNGVENRYIPFDEDIPEGFIKGMLKRKNK